MISQVVPNALNLQNRAVSAEGHELKTDRGHAPGAGPQDTVPHGKHPAAEVKLEGGTLHSYHPRRGVLRAPERKGPGEPPGTQGARPASPGLLRTREGEGQGPEAAASAAGPCGGYAWPPGGVRTVELRKEAAAPPAPARTQPPRRQGARRWPSRSGARLPAQRVTRFLSSLSSSAGVPTSPPTSRARTRSIM